MFNQAMLRRFVYGFVAVVALTIGVSVFSNFTAAPVASANCTQIYFPQNGRPAVKSCTDQWTGQHIPPPDGSIDGWNLTNGGQQYCMRWQFCN
jgi:hypothetical protein